MANGTEKLRAIYEGMVSRGVIREVPDDVQREIRERFISFFARYDSRLRHIRRERVSVRYDNNREGKIRVSCVYHGVFYGKVYNN